MVCATHDGAFPVGSVGCASALRPLIEAMVTRFRKEEKAVSNSNAASSRARHAPLFLEIGKTLLEPIDEVCEFRISAKAGTTWFRPSKTVSRSNRAGNSAGRIPFLLEIGSGIPRSKVKARPPSPDEVCAETRRRRPSASHVLTQNSSSVGFARCLDRGGRVEPMRVRGAHKLASPKSGRRATVRCPSPLG